LSVVISGSIAYDYLMRFPGRFREHILMDHVNRISLSFLVDSMKRQRGGVAPNIAYSLKLLGCDPLILGTAGQDFGDYRKWLEENGLRLDGVKVLEDEFTASFFVNTDLDNNQIATFYAGAMGKAASLSLKGLPKDQVDMVIVSPNSPDAMRKHAREAKELSIPLMYDPSQQVVRLSKEDLIEGINGAKILIVNDYEHALILEKTGLTDQDLLRMAEVIIVTKEEDGSEIITRERRIHIPAAKPRRIAEPTGVGDAYRAGLLAGYFRGLPWEVSGRLGSVAAIFVLEHEGPQEHHYTIDEFIERYKENFGDDPRLERLREKPIRIKSTK
jgi:adenosine kinase